MLKFILKRSTKDSNNGLESSVFITVDCRCEELELLLTNGGVSETGYDVTDLLGVEINPPAKSEELAATVPPEAVAANSVRKAIVPHPTIVCLCGSTRFSEAFRKANLCETLAGKIVLSIGCDFKSDQGLGLTDADKEKLDILHLRKIDLADEVLILNVNGYIGKSTRKELDYALTNNKCVRYLEALQLP